MDKLRESYNYLLTHKQELDKFSSHELETLLFQLEVNLIERNKGIEYEYNQDTQ